MTPKHRSSTGPDAVIWCPFSTALWRVLPVRSHLRRLVRYTETVLPHESQQLSHVNANWLHNYCLLSLPTPVVLLAMRYYILHLTIVMTAMSQLFQDSSAGDIRLDASAGTMLNVKSPSDSQQEAQAGNTFDRSTIDQTAELAIVGATSPDSPNSGVLQPDLSSPQSNQPQPPLGLGDADIPQTIPDRPTNIAQSCSALPHRRMLLRPRGDSCPNIPSSTNYNPALYPGGEELYEKAKLWGVEQERKQCRFWLKTMCCNGPRAFPTDIKDCADCMFWLAWKKNLYIYLCLSLCLSNLLLT